MNSIILAKLLIILYPDEIVEIYKERAHKSEGYKYLTTKPAHDYGYVLEITVKEIDNESK